MNRLIISLSKSGLSVSFIVFVKGVRVQLRKVQFYRLSLLIGCLPFLTGCNKPLLENVDPEINDISFMTGQPCEAPCWQDLILNVSTLDQANKKLAELPFVEKDSISREDNVTIFGFAAAARINYDCIEAKGELCGFLVFSNGLLKVSMHRIQYHLPLKAVIEKLGNPSTLYYTPYSPHGDGCLMDLEYPGENIFIRRVDYSDTRLCQQLYAGKALNPDMEVTEIYYLVTEAFIPGHCQENNCISWPGFEK